MAEDLVPVLVFILISYCIICPPSEFISAGFTIESLFGHFLGPEHENFMLYHIRRTLITLFIYSCIPLGYFICLYFGGQADSFFLLLSTGNWIWKCVATFALALPLLALIQIKNWTDDDYKKHPIVVNLEKYCNNNNRNWRSVASDIAVEFRRVDKISIRTNAFTRIVATENWILKVCPLTIYITHQTDATLTVKKTDTHSLGHQNTLQFVNIEVKSARENVESFTIRINAEDFKDLEDRIGRSIAIMPNVQFHKSILDQFVDVFKDVIKSNPKYETNLVADQCIGCLQTNPNVKLQKLCEDGNDGENCTTCYCRPMWCVECLAKWFASRQDSDRRDSWLSSKCTCPMCRAKFCILDVCYLSEQENN